MKILKEYSLMGIILFLSACSVGKKYQRADLKLPEKYRQDTVSVTADSVLLPWKTFFKDDLLISLIEKSLEKNMDIAISLNNLSQLELTYQQARMRILPSVDFNAGANRTWLSANSLNGSLSDQFLGTPYMDDYSATLRVSWEADIWRKARMQREGALANYFGQKENLSALKTRIILQVAQAYYNLISLDEQMKVAQQNVSLGDSTLAMIRMQYNSAMVSSLALQQAEAQKKTAELLIPLAKQNIMVQENALSILCGSYPEAIERAGRLDAVMPEHVAPDVPAKLLSRRADVRAAEYAVVSANTKIGLAKAAMYPSITLTPSIGANSYKFNSWFDLPGSLIKVIGASLTQPIFEKKSLKTAYEIAQLEQKRTALQFQQTVMTAVGEVSDAMAKSGFADERMLLVEEKNKALQKATGDAMLLYKSGMATYLEVITAQNNALQNELDAISIRREKLNAVTDLYRALGGGVE